MAEPSAQLAAVVRDKLQASNIRIRDFSGGCSGAKLELYVSSSKFSGVKLLDRHRLVNDAVRDAGLFDAAIHALTIKAWTAEEWENKSATIPEDAQLFAH